MIYYGLSEEMELKEHSEIYMCNDMHSRVRLVQRDKLYKVQGGNMGAMRRKA